MAANVTRWCRDCQFCQRAKVTKQPRAAVQAIPIPNRRFSHIHIDLVGPLPHSPEGANHLFTMVDCSSMWLEAIPLTSTDTATIAAAFVSGWVSLLGVPGYLTSDHGPQFCSALCSELSRRWGITHHLTTAYHPQANGMVERAHRQLKDSLRARASSGDWMSHLPWVLLGLRSTPKEDSSLSAAELVYGSPLVTPGQIPGVPELLPAVFQEANRATPTHITGRQPTQQQPPPSIPAALADSSFVYVRRGGAKPPLFLNILCWIWGTGRSHSAWTASNPIWGCPSSHQLPPPTAAALSSQWLPPLCHLGGSSVDTACTVNILVTYINPPE